MPKASPIQNSFSGGEFGPRALGHTDNERYKTGLDTAENYIPTHQGPLHRRPGEKYVTDAKDPSKPPTLIPFKFSQTQNYILEFGDFYMRVHTPSGRVVTSGTSYVVVGNYTADSYGYAGPTLRFPFYASRLSTLPQADENASSTVNSAVISGSILEIPTPYSYLQAQGLKVSQKHDTMILTCSSQPHYALQRFSHTHWTLKYFRTKDGPYLPINSYQSVFDSLNITLNLVRNPEELPFGPTFQMITGSSVKVTNATNNGSGEIRITTTTKHGRKSGDKVYIEGIVGTTEANNGTSFSTTSSVWIARVFDDVNIDLAGSVFTNVYVGSGTVYPGLFLSGSQTDYRRPISVKVGSHRFWGYIDHGATGSSMVNPASGRLVIAPESNVTIPGSSLLVTEWQMGVYCSSLLFPAAASFHEDRLFFGGSRNFPQQLDASMTGLYDTFSLNEASTLVVAANHALQFSLASADLNSIRWIKSDVNGLLSGTLASEWKIAPSSQSAGLSPTDIGAGESGNFGSADIDAAKAGGAVIYVQGSGKRLREMNYFFQVDTYRSTDLCELADHIAGPGFVRLAVQKEPIPIVWGLRSDDRLVSMTYNRDDTTLKVGWAQHKLAGNSDSAGSQPRVKSIAVIPSGDGTYDQLWLATQRRINGTSVVQIGYLEKFFDQNSKQEDAFYVDAGGTYDSPVTVSSILTGTSVLVNTASAHGFSNGDEVMITGVVGINSSTVDLGDFTHTSSLVNYRVFKAGSASGSALYLKELSGSSDVTAIGYSGYVSGGQIRKLVSTISGVTWLKNETIDVLADGRIHGQVTVNSGGIFALDYPAATVQFGYAMKSKGKSLKPDAGSADGSAIGKLKRVSRAAFMLHQVGEFAVGPSFANLTPVSEIQTWQAENMASDTAAPLFSGIVREGLETGFDMDGQICWQQTSPLPGMIQSLTYLLETVDV